MSDVREHNLVVRNTFIDVEVADDEAYEAPERTRSDPTGGRSKDLMHLGRIPEKPMPITVKEGTVEEEAGELEPQRIPEPLSGNLCGINEEEDEDEGIGGLARTVSTAYPQAGLLGAPKGSSSAPGTVTTMALNSLLPKEATGSSAGPVAYAGMGTGVGGFSPWGYPPAYGMYGGMYPWAAPPYTQGNYSGEMAEGILDEAHQGHFGAEMGEEGIVGAGREGHFGAGMIEEGAVGAGREDSAPSDWHPPALGYGPPLGNLHSFHQETRDMGQVSHDFRCFTKIGYEGRLSVVSESRVHADGMHRYLVQFTSGELSRADGVGFVFSSRLPCAKNIQRIVSIFVNQRGRICMRVFADIVRASAYVKPLELGDWVEMAIDLDNQVATFNIWARTPSGWPPLEGRPASTAEFPYGSKLAKLNQDNAAGGSQAPPRRGKGAGAQAKGGDQAKPMKLNVGHLACVVKNVGVTITVGS